MSIRRGVKLLLVLGLAVGLGACSSAADPNYSQEKPFSDSGAQIPVSDLGGEEIVSAGAESEDLIPESVKALKVPKKEDYPDLGRNDDAGAEALAQFFTDAFMYAASVSDGKILSENFDLSECISCDLIMAEIDKKSLNNTYYDHGYASEILSIKLVDYTKDGKALVFYDYILPKFNTYTDGEVVKSKPERQIRSQVFLIKSEKSWLIYDLTLAYNKENTD